MTKMYRQLFGRLSASCCGGHMLRYQYKIHLASDALRYMLTMPASCVQCPIQEINRELETKEANTDNVAVNSPAS